jgi:FkbM family methyltransferase
MLNSRTAITRAKVGLVGTTAGSMYERLRWASKVVQRRRHPELMDFYLEPYRFDFLLTHLIGEDDHCFDGGCHVGSILAQMVRLAPKGEHTAVEPVGHKAAALRRRFPHVRLVEGALGETTGTATFFDDHSGFASFHPDRIHTQVAQGREVEVHTIDDIVGDGKLDLLKLDIEGAELWALKGARKVVEYNEPTILIECGLDGTLEPFGYTRAEMYDYLTEEFGYAVYSVVDFMYGRDPMTYAEFARAGTYPYRGFNYVCVPTHRLPTRLVPEFTREPLF